MLNESDSVPTPELISVDDLRCGDTIKTEDGSEDRVISLIEGYMALASGRIVLLDSQSFELVARVPHADANLWHCGERYYASASDAAMWRKIEARKAEEMQRRFMAVISRMSEQADLAAD